MCIVVILPTRVWIGEQHSLIHREISISSSVLPLSQCELHCIATQEFPYTMDCKHLKYNNIIAPTKLNAHLEIAW
jgi:hypothetical protein